MKALLILCLLFLGACAGDFINSWHVKQGEAICASNGGLYSIYNTGYKDADTVLLYIFCANGVKIEYRAKAYQSRPPMKEIQVEAQP
jgi:hypothetical protein